MEDLLGCTGVSLKALRAQRTGVSPALAEGTGICFLPWYGSQDWRPHVVISPVMQGRQSHMEILLLR